MLPLALESDQSTAETQASWARQLALLLGPRGFRAALAASIVLGVSLLIVSGLPGRLRAWVHERPEYGWSIAEVELDPPPPDWLRIGREGILQAISTPLREYEAGSALSLDLGAVERAFKNVSWVDRVQAVERTYPDRIIVSLEYRQPVAIARIDQAGPEEDRDLLIDGSGVILARLRSDPTIDPAALPDLISVHRLEPPVETDPGTTWSRLAEADQPAQPDPAALAAASLSKFLIESAQRDGWPVSPSGEVFRIDQIHLIDGDENRLILASSTPQGLLWIYWGRAPGLELPGQMAAEEKWRLLQQEISEGLPDHPADRGAFVFTSQGLSWQKEDGG